jgi:ketosteroid isomerase-like protein
MADMVDIVEQGYGAASAGDEEGLRDVFAENAEWTLMRRTKVARTYKGRDAVIEFLLRFEQLRLESIMQLDDIVVAAHSFAVPGGRAVATTVYRFRGGHVIAGKCADVLRARGSGVG